jgi:hypothetical protein
MGRKDIRIDYIMTVAEEIELTTGLTTDVVNETIEVDTMVGKINFKVAFYDLMQDVYRFISIYGSKLQKYGIEQRIKCANN